MEHGVCCIKVIVDAFGIVFERLQVFCHCHAVVELCLLDGFFHCGSKFLLRFPLQLVKLLLLLCIQPEAADPERLAVFQFLFRLFDSLCLGFPGPFFCSIRKRHNDA